MGSSLDPPGAGTSVSTGLHECNNLHPGSHHETRNQRFRLPADPGAALRGRRPSARNLPLRPEAGVVPEAGAVRVTMEDLMFVSALGQLVMQGLGIALG